MILVGLTGGIASGKSMVSKRLQELGAYIIDADQIAHEVVLPGRPAYDAIVEHFGPGILSEDKTIDRARLGSQVFRDAASRTVLEEIIHPRVFEAEEHRRREIAQSDPDAVIIFDAPLLIETGAHELMDRVVLVVADRKTQISRLVERDRLDPAEAQRRIEAQLPVAEKERHADFVIDGNAAPSAVARQTEAIFEQLRRLARRDVSNP